MSQSYLVASKVLRKFVKPATSHSCTKIAWVAFCVVCNVKDLCFKHLYGYSHKRRIVDYPLPVCVAVAGVHHNKLQPDIHALIFLQMLHTLSKEHWVLAAWYAHRYLVARLYHIVTLISHYELVPYISAKISHDAPLYLLLWRQYSWHLKLSLKSYI